MPCWRARRVVDPASPRGDGDLGDIDIVHLCADQAKAVPGRSAFGYAATSVMRCCGEVRVGRADEVLVSDGIGVVTDPGQDGRGRGGDGPRGKSNSCRPGIFYGLASLSDNRLTALMEVSRP